MQQVEAGSIRRKILGVLLRNARVRAGLSMKDAAKAVSFSSSAISDYEYGRRDISLPQLEALAHTYGVPITYFWTDDPIPDTNHVDFPIEKAMDLRRRIIGVLLRQARQDKDCTQQELADVLDCSSSRIGSYEFGRADIPLPELEKLAEFLEVPLSYFLDQGMTPGGERIAGAEEMEHLAELPEDVRKFLLQPANLLYVRVAMKLSSLSAETLRVIAEGLLDISY
jgi:transcriptional regulator with XRE-family HTH domain